MIRDNTYFLKSNKNLFDATLLEFSEKSYDVASLNTIIKQSDFNKGSFYYRFNDKFDLYSALMADIFLKQSEAIDLILKMSSSNYDLRKVLETLFGSQYDIWMENKLYLDVLKNFSEESELLKGQIYQACGKPLIKWVLDDFSIKYDEIFHNPQIQKSLFLRILESYYYRTHSFFLDGFSKENLSILIDYVLYGFLHDNRNKSNLLLDINRVSYTYRHTHHGIEEVSLKIFENEIISLVGPHLSGKSTLMNILIGNLNPDMGKIMVVEKKNAQMRDDDNEKQAIMTFSRINSRKSCRQNLALYAKLYQSTINLNDLLIEFGLAPMSDIRLAKLSEFNQLLTRILCTYIANPKVIVIDDVFSAFVDSEIIILLSLLSKCRLRGSSVVMMCSHMREALSISDRIGFIVLGRLVRVIETQALKKKYASRKILVKYLDGGIERITLISIDDLQKEEFKNIAKNHHIVSMDTLKVLPDEIFKIENGVDLG
jgi:ABC-type multidrug transport system ATPase subunit